MLRIVTALLIALLLSTRVEAGYYCENADEKDTPAQLLACIKSERETTAAYADALEATRSIAASPVAVLEMIQFGVIREAATDLSVAARRIYRALEMKLGPETYLSPSYNRRMGATDPFMPLRALYSGEAALSVWFAFAESKIVEVITRFAIQGAILAGVDRLEPILIKPADSLLAQKGMRWIFEHRCTEENPEDRKPVCLTTNFPSEFKAYYGLDATEENVWFLGFLNRRDLERRGMSTQIQRWALDFHKKFGDKR